MTEAAKKSRFELVVELVKAVAWPTLVALLLLSFWSPLQRTADLIPSIVGRSDTITIAGLSLKIGQGLRNKATPEVERVLAKMSKAGIERVLGMSESAWWDKGSIDFARAENKEIVALGLAVEVPTSEIEQRNAADKRNFGYAVRITALGKQTQAFLRSVVAEFVQELAVPPKGTGR